MFLAKFCRAEWVNICSSQGQISLVRVFPLLNDVLCVLVLVCLQFYWWHNLIYIVESLSSLTHHFLILLIIELDPIVRDMQGFSSRDCPRQRYWDILPYFSKKSHCYFEMTNFYHWNLIRICAILELVWNSPIVLQVQAYPCPEYVNSIIFFLVVFIHHVYFALHKELLQVTTHLRSDLSYSGPIVMLHFNWHCTSLI